jgi:thiazole synthase
MSNWERITFVKLEVISDPKYLLPDPIGTLKAAEFLLRKGSLFYHI